MRCSSQVHGRLDDPGTDALLAVLLLSSAGTAQAYECKSTYKSAEAIAPTKVQSTAAVKVIWHNTVNDIYGLHVIRLDFAMSQADHCKP